VVKKVEIESKYKCQEDYGIKNVEGLNCLLDNSVHLDVISQSNKAEVSEASHVTDG